MSFTGCLTFLPMSALITFVPFERHRITLISGFEVLPALLTKNPVSWDVTSLPPEQKAG